MQYTQWSTQIECLILILDIIHWAATTTHSE